VAIIHSDTQNSCQWDSSGHVQVALTSDPYDSLVANGGQISDLTFSGRPAVQSAGAGGPGACDVSLEATSGSRALIAATTDSNLTDQACTLAQGVAKAISPKLPSGSK
jgi:hypothetical protein